MIRKSWYLAVIAGTLLVPAVTFAASFASGPTVTITDASQAKGNLYTAGGTITISVPVTGDLYAAGGSLTMQRAINGDLTAAGGTLNILAPVHGDVRVAGGTITLGDTVEGDVVVMGGQISLLPGTFVFGDVIVMGGKVTISGTVRGNVLVRSQNGLTLDPAARIGGNLTYRAPHALPATPGVAGKVLYEPLRKFGFAGAQYGFKAMLWAILAFLTAVKMIAYLGAVLLAVWFLNRPVAAVFQDVVSRWWPSVGRGVAYLILVPIGAVLLMISVVGILPSVLLGLMYAGLLIVAKVLSGMFFGAWLHAKMHKRTDMQITWLNAIGGLLAFTLISIIPVLGAITQALIFLAIFGVLATRAQKMFVL